MEVIGDILLVNDVFSAEKEGEWLRFNCDVLCFYGSWNSVSVFLRGTMVVINNVYRSSLLLYNLVWHTSNGKAEKEWNAET